MAIYEARRKDASARETLRVGKVRRSKSMAESRKRHPSAKQIGSSAAAQHANDNPWEEAECATRESEVKIVGVEHQEKQRRCFE